MDRDDKWDPGAIIGKTSGRSRCGTVKKNGIVLVDFALAGRQREWAQHGLQGPSAARAHNADLGRRHQSLGFAKAVMAAMRNADIAA